MFFLRRSFSLSTVFEACQFASSNFHARSQINCDHAYLDTIEIFPSDISFIVPKTPQKPRSNIQNIKNGASIRVLPSVFDVVAKFIQP